VREVDLFTQLLTSKGVGEKLADMDHKTATPYKGFQFTRLHNYHTKAPFTQVRTNFCTDKNLHGSTLRLHETGGTGRILERLSVLVWDLKKVGPKFAHLTVQKSV